MEKNKLICGNALTELKQLPGESVDCVMTSPPYWALRDYGLEPTIWDGDEKCNHKWGNKLLTLKHKSGETNPGKEGWFKNKGASDDKGSNFCSKCNAWKGCLGLEPNFNLFIKHLCDIFDEVKRVLKKSGTCWVNLGDVYYGGGQGGADYGGKQTTPSSMYPRVWQRPSREAFKKAGFDGKCLYCGKKVKGKQFCNTKCLNKMGNDFRSQNRQLPNKCLVQIPFRFSIEMTNRGWILRNTIIWHKKNAMPSSVKDRFTVDFEYLFFFVKEKKYFFEQQRETLNYDSFRKTKRGFNQPKGNRQEGIDNWKVNPKGRNKRTTWTINPRPFPGAHFAVYPEELCETPIRAGCPEKGVVLDPFLGAGTTAVAALKQNKKFIGIELNPDYIKIAKKRLRGL